MEEAEDTEKKVALEKAKVVAKGKDLVVERTGQEPAGVESVETNLHSSNLTVHREGSSVLENVMLNVRV